MHVSLTALSALFLVCVSAQGLTGEQIDTVQQLLAEGATHSWELGTRAQALLELSAPSFSVLTPFVPLPPSTSLNSSLNNSLANVFTIAQHAVEVLPPPPSNGSGQPLTQGDGSAGDPASIGVAVLIANWTNLGGEDYANAATAQIQYLLGPAVPKTQDGAISHRISELQLWSDSVFMVPPFLAYYGVTTSNTSMLQEAYNQVKLYRSYLRNESAGGLWKHIVLGENGTDPGHWSTGNGWAAAGISAFSPNFTSEINDLGNWQANGLFKNYADDNSSRNFDDAASSALLAATVYRLALLTGHKTYIYEAELTRAALFAGNGTSANPSGVPVVTSSNTPPSSISWSSSNTPPSSMSWSSSNTPPSTSWSPSNTPLTPSLAEPAPGPASTASSAFMDTPHFTIDGWLAPVVDPLNFAVEGAQSPEGQAFVLMLESAWRDWSESAAGRAVTKKNVAPSRPRVCLSTVVLGAVGVGLSWLV
ncbi:Six-hairpin glycosidase-like protein [Lactarius quietus]|nr:Six-hairpin glycosidase-like protein [Lactarius quietus]